MTEMAAAPAGTGNGQGAGRCSRLCCGVRHPIGIFFMNIPFMAQSLADVFGASARSAGTVADQASWWAMLPARRDAARLARVAVRRRDDGAGGKGDDARRAGRGRRPVLAAQPGCSRFGLVDLFDARLGRRHPRLRALAALFLFPFLRAIAEVAAGAARSAMPCTSSSSAR